MTIQPKCHPEDGSVKSRHILWQTVHRIYFFTCFCLDPTDKSQPSISQLALLQAHTCSMQYIMGLLSLCFLQWITRLIEQHVSCCSTDRTLLFCVCLQQQASWEKRSRDREKARVLKLKPESGPSPAWLAAHRHPCSFLQAFMWSILQKPTSRGNVSLLANQETSMPKQGASCPDTALPVGYVRTFLPSLLSSP